MPKDTKTALLISAEQAARRLGFDGFSYADLAEDVGIRKASIHHHFPTKAALSVALMQRYSARIDAACVEISETHATAASQLGAFVALYRAALGDGSSLCLCVSFSISRAHLSQDAVVEITAFRQLVIAWLKRVYLLGLSDHSIAGISDPDQEAAATLALLEGAQLAARAEENVSTFDAAVASIGARITA